MPAEPLVGLRPDNGQLRSDPHDCITMSAHMRGLRKDVPTRQYCQHTNALGWATVFYGQWRSLVLLGGSVDSQNWGLAKMKCIPISIRQAFNFAWPIFKQRFGLFTAVLLTIFSAWVTLEIVVIAGQRFGILVWA